MRTDYSKRICRHCGKEIPRDEPAWFDEFGGTYSCKACIEVEGRKRAERRLGAVAIGPTAKLEAENAKLLRVAKAARAFLVVNGQATKEDADCLRKALALTGLDADQRNSIEKGLELADALAALEESDDDDEPTPSELMAKAY
jgi:hypothetical protein